MPRHVNPEQRRNDLARIHVLKKELGWDEDLYRDVMATVCGGIRSSAQLDLVARQRLLTHMLSCKARSAAKPVRKPLTPVGRKLWSLWMQLADAGLIQHRSMAALTAWVQRQTGVDRIEWLNKHQATLVIESLKLWAERGQEGGVA